MTRNELLKIRGINNKFQYIVWCINNIKEFKINNTLKNDLLTHYNNWNVQRERKHIHKQMKQYNLTASDYLSLLETHEI